MLVLELLKDVDCLLMIIFEHGLASQVRQQKKK